MNDDDHVREGPQVQSPSNVIRMYVAMWVGLEKAGDVLIKAQTFVLQMLAD